MKKKIFIFYIFLYFTFIFNLWGQEIKMRVAIKQDAQSVRVTVKGPYKINALNSDQELLKSDSPLNYNLAKANAYGIELGQEVFKVFGVEVIPLETKEIYVDGIPYKGSIILIRKENLNVLVVNRVPLEEYLKGVLFHEVCHLWPMETLKAQAVAARTFALSQIKDHVGYNFDVTSDIYSQVYGGSYSERLRPSLAVEQTEAEVLTFHGEVFPAYYHAVCAGKTEDASVLWNTNIRPLKGSVHCDYCRFSPHYKWVSFISLDQLQDKLKGLLGDSFQIVDIQAKSFTKSGRIHKIAIIREDLPAQEVSAKDFRYKIGPNLIKSTNFTVEFIDQANVKISGFGWGHGVGMCQWGAFFLGARGMGYQDILHFYYPFSIIKTINEIN